MTHSTYIGSELELFARARNWKTYWTGLLRPHIRGRVLEVGAGMGANTALLTNDRVRAWVCLEPDPSLVAKLETRISREPGLQGCQVLRGTLERVPESEKFDTIIYVDVLEHIEDDRSELERASSHLTSGGRLAVLAPAHPWLFTRFDEAIGHFRRYTASSLRNVAPARLRLLSLRYLDTAGLLASAANRVLLNSSMPSEGQIAFWDTVLVAASRLLDPLLRYRLGKSVLAIWAFSRDGS